MIGNIRYVDACFTKLEDKSKRELQDEKYGGSFTELGSYCLLPIIKLFGAKYEDVSFESIHGENGLNLFTKASFRFESGQDHRRNRVCQKLYVSGNKETTYLC